jgi:hypothetical protein
MRRHEGLGAARSLSSMQRMKQQRISQRARGAKFKF